jgi:uncharacterized protein YbjQ (UPF0145 family)
MTDAGHWVPEAGRGRLAESAAGKCFTSDLTVDEFVLVHELGFDPLGLVMGTSMYHVGIQVARWGSSQELTVLTQAMYSGRELALERMVTEAEQLQADGIVGVDLTLVMYSGGQDVLEFLAVGTAVRSRSQTEPYRTPGGRPFSSALSGGDFYKLVRSGFIPTGFAFGTCVYHIAHQSAMQSLRQTGQNTEMPQYTQAVYDARELAMTRMQADGERSGGIGVVGVHLEHHNHVWGEHAVEFLVVGTAVRRLQSISELGQPALVLPI